MRKLISGVVAAKRMAALVLLAGMTIFGMQPAFGAGHEDMHGAHSGSAAQASGIAATGEVRGVNAAAAKIKLKHDPIPSIGWPSMIMDFRVANPKLLDGLKEGDRVSFTLEKSARGYDITTISKPGK